MLRVLRKGPICAFPTEVGMHEVLGNQDQKCACGSAMNSYLTVMCIPNKKCGMKLHDNVHKKHDIAEYVDRYHPTNLTRGTRVSAVTMCVYACVHARAQEWKIVRMRA